VVTFHIYVRAAVARMMGRQEDDPVYTGVLQGAITYRAKRDLFAFARATWDGPTFSVTPLPGRGSADVFAPAMANALIYTPAGTRVLEQGDEVEFRFLGPRPLGGR
jgi:molybdopterin biosynthesis enzyme